MDHILTDIGVSLLAGILPALLWLWFWLHEDRERPEPRWLIFSSFLGGMGVVFLAIMFENSAYKDITNQTQLITVWAAIEELLKFAAAYVIALRSQAYDEPLDAVIYLMCVALGFAALENALFVLTPITQGNPTAAIFTINLRFIGATLLHTIASGCIGVSLALTFYKSQAVKIIGVLIGVIVAIGLHTWFNLSIIRDNSNGIFIIFSVVWLAIVVLILLLEKVKKLNSITK